MIKIPEKIKIAGIEYDIEYTDDKEIDYLGLSSTQHSLIKLNKNMNKSKTEQIFFHELTHEILKNLGCHLGDQIYHNENFTQSFSLILHQIISQIKVVGE